MFIKLSKLNWLLKKIANNEINDTANLLNIIINYGVLLPKTQENHDLNFKNKNRVALYFKVCYIISFVLLFLYTSTNLI